MKTNIRLALLGKNNLSCSAIGIVRSIPIAGRERSEPGRIKKSIVTKNRITMIQNRNQQVQLCKNLNMNFDEASELFGNETLGDMQLAKVCGGVLPSWVLKGVLKRIHPAFTIAFALYAVYDSFNDTEQELAWHLKVEGELAKGQTADGKLEFSFGSFKLDYHTEPSGSNQAPCGAQDTVYIKAPGCPCGSTTVPTN